MAELQVGVCLTPGSHDAVDKNKKIAELKRMFSSNEISLDDYIQGLAGHTSLILCRHNYIVFLFLLLISVVVLHWLVLFFLCFV